MCLPLQELLIRKTPLKGEGGYTVSVTMSHVLSEESRISEWLPLERLGLTQRTYHNYHQSIFESIDVSA